MSKAEHKIVYLKRRIQDLETQFAVVERFANNKVRQCTTSQKEIKRLREYIKNNKGAAGTPAPDEYAYALGEVKALLMAGIYTPGQYVFSPKQNKTGAPSVMWKVVDADGQLDVEFVREI